MKHEPGARLGNAQLKSNKHMNISIKITYKTGTTVDLSIPLQDANTSISAPQQPSAVVYQEAPTTLVEEPIVAQETAPSIGNDDEVVGFVVSNEDLRPSGKRYKSVEEMVAVTCPELAHEIISEKGCEGEDGVGDGRIGGVGERKEEAGEGEGRGEKHERFEALNYDAEIDTPLDGFEFPCENGSMYVPPMPLVRDFILAFGEEHVRVEFLKARSWLTANPDKRKTYRGMGRYLNTWLCHNSGMKRIAVKQILETKSLLANGKQTQEGW